MANSAHLMWYSKIIRSVDIAEGRCRRRRLGNNAGTDTHCTLHASTHTHPALDALLCGLESRESTHSSGQSTDHFELATLLIFCERDHLISNGMSTDDADEECAVTGDTTASQEGDACASSSVNDSTNKGQGEDQNAPGLSDPPTGSSEPPGATSQESEPLSVDTEGEEVLQVIAPEVQPISKTNDSIVVKLDVCEPGKLDEASGKAEEPNIRGDEATEKEVLDETIEQRRNQDRQAGISALSLYQAMTREQEAARAGTLAESHAKSLRAPATAPAPPLHPLVPGALGMYANYHMGYHNYYRGYPTQHSTYPSQHIPVPTVGGPSPYLPTPAAAPGDDALAAAAHQEWWTKYYEHYYKLTAYNMMPGMAPPPPPNPWALHALPTLISQHTTIKGAEAATDITLPRKKQRVDEAANKSQLKSTNIPTEEEGDNDTQKGDPSGIADAGEKISIADQAKQQEGKTIGDIVSSLTNMHRR